MTSIFFRNFSTLSCVILGIEKVAFSDKFSSQNNFSSSKLDGKIGSLISEATDTKNLLNSDAMSEAFSNEVSLIFMDKMLLLVFRLLAPSSLNSFHILAGLFALSWTISEYCCFFR